VIPLVLLHYIELASRSSCDLRRERTARNGSHFVVNVALMDEGGASNDKQDLSRLYNEFYASRRDEERRCKVRFWCG